MASNYNRKSSASGSRRSTSSGAPKGRSSSQSAKQRPSRASQASRASSGYAGRRGSAAARNPYQASKAARNPYQASKAPYQRVTSVRVGDLDQAIRAHRVQRSYRRYVVRIVIVLVSVAAFLVAGIIMYNSSLFTISHVAVKGVEHLTATEMTELASVPAGTTLLRVDEAGIKNRLSEEAWVDSVSVNRVFPDTLELAITERTIAAVVEVPADNAQTIETWAISSGGMWLMLIPPLESAEAAAVSPKVYEDSASVLRITGVPYGLVPTVGEYCSDDNVNNALSIIDGLTTSLAEQVKTVSATGTETATLILNTGIEIAFGTAEDIREKERVCLELMEKYPDRIAYINVRVVDRPTWRSA